MVSHTQCFLGLSLLIAPPYLIPFLSLHLNYCIRLPSSYSLTRSPLRKLIPCSTTGLIVKIQFWLLYSKAFNDSPLYTRESPKSFIWHLRLSMMRFQITFPTGSTIHRCDPLLQPNFLIYPDMCISSLPPDLLSPFYLIQNLILPPLPR